MLTYRDIRDLLIPRAERLGLTAPESNQADAAELEMYMFQALLSLIELNDLTEYTVRNANIGQTEIGRTDYPLPPDFGRLVLPRPMMTRGIQLEDDGERTELTYLDADQFSAKRSNRNQRPDQFTVMRRRLYLFPTPDAQYTIRGLYIERVGRPQLDDEVLLEYPTALVEETLFRLASDAGRVTQALVGTRNEAMAKLVGGPLGNPERIGRNFVERKAG